MKPHSRRPEKKTLCCNGITGATQGNYAKKRNTIYEYDWLSEAGFFLLCQHNELHATSYTTLGTFKEQIAF